MSHTATLLEMRGIRKQFGGLVALDDVTFGCHPGEVHALVGENGAGKSTLMNILAGVHRLDAGEIRIDGRRVSLGTPAAAQAMGIVTIFQEFRMIPQLNVAENIFLGREPRKLGWIRSADLYRGARDALQRVRLDVDPRAPISSLSVAEQQMVEIARALSCSARILVMDEPTAALNKVEADRLLQVIADLRRSGVTVIYVSHRLDEIFRVADRVTVLKDGRLVTTLPTSELDRDRLVRLMVGREVGELFPPRTGEPGAAVLSVRGLRRPPVLREISFELRRGEVLGLAGLQGAGRTELARALFGADPNVEGTILVDGNQVAIRSPIDAIRAGIGLVTENRKDEGLALGLPIVQNATAAVVRALARWGLVRRAGELDVAGQILQQLQFRGASLAQPAGSLSGGNQQKVVLAKWLLTRPKILVLDEPTRGVDVGAKREIYQLIRRLAAEGIAILLISSELPEVLGLSDRLLVMHNGRIVREVARSDATEEQVMRAAAGLE